MRLAPRPMVPEIRRVAQLDGRAWFATRRVRGGAEIVCRQCGAALRLEVGFTGADAMKHEPGCTVGRVISAASKPVYVAERQGRES